MKKLFLIICSFALVNTLCACDNHTAVLSTIETATESTSIMEEKAVLETETPTAEASTERALTYSEQVVNTWLESVASGEDVSDFFDPNAFSEEQIAYCKSCIQSGGTYRIFYEKENEIMFMLNASNGAIGYLHLIGKNDVYIATDSEAIREQYLNCLCTKCSGKRQIITGSHEEYGQYACAICGGSGFQNTQYYDSFVGWQTMMIGCGRCCGTGYLTGLHTVYEYAPCDACDGFGVQ